MIKNITCVTCPMGCAIKVEISESGEILSVSGNTCKRCETYAANECTHPVRSLTSTVRVEGGAENVVPCKSAAPIPKEKIFDCMKEINSARASAPVTLGDVLIENICGTGVNIVATNHCAKK